MAQKKHDTRAYYLCQRGHKQRHPRGETEWSYQTNDAKTGKAIADTGPLCHECWDMPEVQKAIAAAVTEHMGTQRQAPPKKRAG